LDGTTVEKIVGLVVSTGTITGTMFVGISVTVEVGPSVVLSTDGEKEGKSVMIGIATGEESSSSSSSPTIKLVGSLVLDILDGIDEETRVGTKLVVGRNVATAIGDIVKVG